jgi:hypothetical protein
MISNFGIIRYPSASKDISQTYSVVNVKDFGAVGDGVHDDTAAVQKALDQRGLIVFPSGTYLCGALVMRSNSKILGLGNVTLLHNMNTGYVSQFPRAVICNENLPPYAAPGDPNRPSTVGLAQNMEIENITFDGQGQHVYGPQFIASDYVRMKDVTIKNMYGCLDLRAIRYSYFYNVLGDNIAGDGISITDQNFGGARGYTTQVVFENCTIQNSCSADGDSGPDVTMNAFETDDGASFVYYINCKAINNTGSGFEFHVHTTDYDISDIYFINCVAINNRPKPGITRTIGGFVLGQCPNGSFFGRVRFENCTSIGSPSALALDPGSQTGYKQDISIIGGYYQNNWTSSTVNDDTNSCIRLNDYFRNVRITGADIVGCTDGSGVFSYGTADGLKISNCTIRGAYSPLRLLHSGGALSIENNDITATNPVLGNSTVCVYAHASNVNIAKNRIAVDATKYSSSIVRVISPSYATISGNQIQNTSGSPTNNGLNIDTATYATVTGNIISSFTNAVYLSNTSTAVVCAGNSFKGCTSKYNTTPAWLVDNGNAI